MRSKVSRMGARSPSVAYPGSSPIRKVGIAMAATDKVNDAPSEPITDMADQRAADRAHQIAERKHAERRKQLGNRILMRKELTADRRREIAVDREVVPLEHIADRAGGNDPERLSGFHLFPASCESARDCKL
jgi:hypothetical protein